MEIRSVSNAAVNRPTVSSIPEAGVAASASLESSAGASTVDKKSSSAVVGGYISPYINYDQGARVAVLLFRNVETGATEDQIPSRRVVEEYRRTASRLGGSTEAASGEGSTNSSATSAKSAAAGSPSTTGATNAGTAPASLGVSFASFGASGTSSAASSFAATGSSPTGDSGIGTSTAPAAVSGGGGGSYSGGLVSVTV